MTAEKAKPEAEVQEHPIIAAGQDLIAFVELHMAGPAELKEPQWKELKALDEAFGEHLPLLRNRAALPALEANHPDYLPNCRLPFRTNPGFKGSFKAANIDPRWWMMDYKRWLVQFRNFIEETRARESAPKT